MGVTLQVYRCRIGTFQSCSIKCSNDTDTSPTSLKSTVTKAGILSLLLIIVSAMAASQVNLSYPDTPSLLHTQLSKQDSHHSDQFNSSRKLQDTPSWLTKKDRNFYAKMTFGNRRQRGHGIKILHWNKGPSFLQNKHDDIATISGGHKPHVLGLSESNLKSDHNLGLVQHTCPTLDNPQLKMSRVVVYTHKSLVVKRRHDLEDSSVSAIWLEAGLPR